MQDLHEELMKPNAVLLYALEKDAKINVIFAGHYATETIGVKALQKLIKEKFGVETFFINAPTKL